jgi:hypothetical protein|tara:strand:+ start:814 stop:1518 length:705 start_codon:yes stop_codon:yes gene_type:complete
MRAIALSLIAVNILYFLYQGFYLEPKPTTLSVRSVDGSLDPVYLLTESSSAGLQRQKELDQVISNPILLNVDENRLCQAIGPFEDLFAGQAAHKKLVALALDVELKAVDRPTAERDYRVMIPPATSLQAAFRKLRELKSQEIDSYVITQGDDALGISLGVFSTNAAAVSLQNTLQSSGYAAEITAIPILDRRFWLYGTDGGDFEISAALLAELTIEYPGIRQKEGQCVEQTIKY